MPSPRRPTGTLLPSNNKSAQNVLQQSAVALFKQYSIKSPRAKQYFLPEMAQFMAEVSEAHISPELAAEWLQKLESRNADEARGKEILGWLFIHAGLMAPDEQAWAERLGLKNDPWCIYPKDSGIEASTPMPQSAPVGNPRNDDLDLAVYTHADFLSAIGSIQKQPILILEDLVDGSYCLLWLLYASMRYWQFDGSDRVRFAIADMTGEDYWGFASVGNVVWHAGALPEMIEPGEDEDLEPYLEMMEFRDGLPFAYKQLLPIMECTYLAMSEYEGRMERKRKKEATGFHPFLVVFRRWNVMLRLWRGMSAKGEISQHGLNQAWRKIYGHGPNDRVDLARDVDFLLQGGDSVNMIPVLTSTELGRVEAIGVDQSQLNSMAIIVPGDGAADSNRGFKALLEIVRDSRLRLGNEGNLIRDNLPKAISWSIASGDQVALVIGGREPWLYRVSKCVKGADGQETNIRRIPSRKMLQNYRFAAAS